MALVTSGSISMGGSTTGRSINLELGQSATATISLDSRGPRDLSGQQPFQVPGPSYHFGVDYDASANTFSPSSISLGDFYGDDNDYSGTLTVGTGGYLPYGKYAVYQNFYGYGNYYTPSSSLNDKIVQEITAYTHYFAQFYIQVSGSASTGTLTLIMYGANSDSVSNSGWTWVRVNSTTFYRSSATFTALGGVSGNWQWSNVSNPFGTTSGATKTITFG